MTQLRCGARGPYLPVGDTDWTCYVHGEDFLYQNSHGKWKCAYDHKLSGDSLCNYRCSCDDWQYSHVGWGEPDKVAIRQHKMHLSTLRPWLVYRHDGARGQGTHPWTAVQKNGSLRGEFRTHAEAIHYISAQINHKCLDCATPQEWDRASDALRKKNR